MEFREQAEDPRGQHIKLYTPDVLKKLDSEGILKFKKAVELLRASIEELRDINGVKTTDENLHNHELIDDSKLTSTIPTLRLWDNILTRFTDRTPFLIAIERDGEVAAVGEGRIYPFKYDKAEKERAIFIEQIGVRPEYRGNRKNNVVNLLYKQLHDLAEAENVTLIVAGVNVQNEVSKRVIELQGFEHVDEKYLKNPEWPDEDIGENKINVVFEYYIRHLDN